MADRQNLAQIATELTGQNRETIVKINGVFDSNMSIATAEIVRDYSKVIELLEMADKLAEATRGETFPLGYHERFAPLDEKKVPAYDRKNPSFGLLEDIRRVNKLSADFRTAREAE